jgi:integrase
MAIKRGNPDQYLQKVGGTYYARVRVPRTLEKYLRQTHIRRTLETGDRAEANSRKHAVVGRLKAELDRLRKAPTEALGRGISFADAKLWREDLRAAEAADDEGVLHHEIHDAAINKAEELERLYGTDKAKRWFRAATTTSATLAEQMDGWLAASDYKASTNARHRKALAEVLKFVSNDHAAPSEVTRKVAMAFIDTDLTQRVPGLSHNTIRDRLVSLGGFWKWMAGRDAVAAGVNPWAGHRVSKQSNRGRSPPKRKGGYTDAEIVKLLTGNARVQTWPTYAYMPDLMVLGLFTGAREESLCALRADSVEEGKGTCTLHIINDKNASGVRPVGITHPAPLAVLKRRMIGKQGQDLLFPELKPGGIDAKLSSSAVKAYGRYRRACGVPDGTDFHSFRRNVITTLENAGVGQVPIARFVGHQVGTMAGDSYSGGGSITNSLKTSKKIRYSAPVEAAANALATQGV